MVTYKGALGLMHVFSGCTLYPHVPLQSTPVQILTWTGGRGRLAWVGDGGFALVKTRNSSDDDLHRPQSSFLQ